MPDHFSPASVDSTLPSMLTSARNLLSSVRRVRTHDLSSRVIGQASQPSLTFVKSTPDSDPSTSFTADTHANRSPKQDTGEQSLIPDIYGRSSLAAFAFYDPGSSSWKTLQDTLFEASTLSSLTWPRWGMTSNGVAYPRLRLEHHTNETDCSESLDHKWAGTLLPTPTNTRGRNITARRIGTRKPKHKGWTLADVLWAEHIGVKQIGEITSQPSDSGNQFGVMPLRSLQMKIDV